MLTKNKSLQSILYADESYTEYGVSTIVSIEQSCEKLKERGYEIDFSKNSSYQSSIYIKDMRNDRSFRIFDYSVENHDLLGFAEKLLRNLWERNVYGDEIVMAWFQDGNSKTVETFNLKHGSKKIYYINGKTVKMVFSDNSIMNFKIKDGELKQKLLSLNAEL